MSCSLCADVNVYARVADMTLVCAPCFNQFCGLCLEPKSIVGDTAPYNHTLACVMCINNTPPKIPQALKQANPRLPTRP